MRLEEYEEVTWQECYKGIAHAIIKSACEDYIRIPEETFRKNGYARKSLERFFNSREFALYTSNGIDPEYIISKLKEKRAWNEMVRKQIREKYGSFLEFGKVIYPHNKRQQRDCVRVWLKSAQYPTDIDKWKEALGDV